MFKSFEWILVIERKDQETINFVKKNKKRYLKYKIGNYKSIEKSFSVGLLKSKGKYINFHGDDDFFIKKSIKLINQKLFKNNYEWIIFHGDYVDGKFNKIRKLMSSIKFFFLKNNNLFDISLINYVMTPSIFIKKKLLIKYGGFGKKKKHGSDYMLWLKVNYYHKPKIFLNTLTSAMITKNTVSGKFEISRYLFLLKKMMIFTRYNIVIKIIIVLLMMFTIIYNLLSKVLITKFFKI